MISIFTPNAYPVAVGLEVCELPAGEAPKVEIDDQVVKLALPMPDLYTLDGEGLGPTLGRSIW